MTQGTFWSAAAAWGRGTVPGRDTGDTARRDRGRGGFVARCGLWIVLFIDWTILNNIHTNTGCPVKLFLLGYLLFCRLLLMQIAKVGMFLKNSRNLLQDRHKNFENWFRNSWDNWGQSWQPSFRNWHFAITQRQKNNFYVKGGNFDLNYLSYF